MPIRISLTIEAIITIIIGMMLLLPTTGFAVDSSTLLQFLDTEHTPLFPLLPASFPITDSFKPSTNSYAGTVTQVQGTVYVYHQNGTAAYKLKSDLPLFNGDTLVTEEKSSVTLQMADDTTLTLAAQTKLVIDRSLPLMKARDTVLQLFFGRIRAQVKKLTGEYRIRTTTAALSVQGSDFAVAVAPAPKNRPQRWEKKTPAELLTAVLTGGNQSTVELAGLFGPSIMVKPFSAAGVYSGSRAEQVVHAGPAAASLLQRIAPIPQTEFSPGRSSLPNLPNLPNLPIKSAPVAAAPCWPFPDTGTDKILKYFRVCDKIKKPDIKL